MCSNINRKDLSHTHTRMEASIRYTRNVMISGLLFLVLLFQTSQDVHGTEILGCQIFRFMHNNSCHLCPGNCRVCVSDTNCTLCKRGFYGSTCDKACRGECRGTCHKLYGHCTYGCPDGDYPAESKGCRLCPNYCTLCESQSKCVLCDDGHSGEACQDKCPDNCSRCNKSTRQCLQCKNAYFLQDGQCKSCPFGSRLCSNTTDSQECEDGFFGPINGSCLLTCSACVEKKYILPDKDGRCGIWQDTETNICDNFGQNEHHKCTSSGNCLQDVSCSCPVAGNCNSKQVKNSSCSTVRQYNCTHQCSKVSGYFVCEDICSLRSDNRGITTSGPVTLDALPIVALTFKNTNEVICHQVEGSKSKSNGAIIVSIIGYITVVIFFIIIIIIIRRRSIVKTISKLRTQKNNRRYENDKVPESEDQPMELRDMEEIPSSVPLNLLEIPT